MFSSRSSSMSLNTVFVPNGSGWNPLGYSQGEAQIQLETKMMEHERKYTTLLGY